MRLTFARLFVQGEGERKKERGKVDAKVDRMTDDGGRQICCGEGVSKFRLNNEGL